MCKQMGANRSVGLAFVLPGVKIFKKLHFTVFMKTGNHFWAFFCLFDACFYVLHVFLHPYLLKQQQINNITT